MRNEGVMNKPRAHADAKTVANDEQRRVDMPQHNAQITAGLAAFPSWPTSDMRTIGSPPAERCADHRSSAFHPDSPSGHPSLRWTARESPTRARRSSPLDRRDVPREGSFGVADVGWLHPAARMVGRQPKISHHGPLAPTSAACVPTGQRPARRDSKPPALIRRGPVAADSGLLQA